MSNTTVRISEATHVLLKKLAREEQRPMLAILDRAIEEYRRRRFLESVNDAYAALRQDNVAWAECAVERGGWDDAILDGLTDEDHGPEVSRPAPPHEREHR